MWLNVSSFCSIRYSAPVPGLTLNEFNTCTKPYSLAAMLLVFNMKRGFWLIGFILSSILAFWQNFKFKSIDSTHIFDKAKYHIETVKSENLSDTQAFVHPPFL